MKSFVENSNNLKIINFSKASTITEESSIPRIEASIAQIKTIGDLCSNTSDVLMTYLDDIESTVNMIFAGIESKIEYMEQYCDAITSNANQIPYNSMGYIHVYSSDIKLTNMSYIKGKGFILDAD